MTPAPRAGGGGSLAGGDDARSRAAGGSVAGRDDARPAPDTAGSSSSRVGTTSERRRVTARSELLGLAEITLTAPEAPA